MIEWASVYIVEGFSDEDIVNLIENPQKEGHLSDTDGEEERTTDIATITKAVATLDIVLRFVEQHSTATPSDVMFMCRWQSIASAETMSCLRKFNMKDFIM